MCAYKHNIYPFKDYIILGDDIVITNDTVALEYKFMISQLGVEISQFKTHVSKNTYEFAKRWFRNQVEISGLPINGLLDSIKRPQQLFGSIYQLYLRGNSPIKMGTSFDVTMDLISRTMRRSRISRVHHILLNFYVTIRNSIEFDYQLTRRIWGIATRNNEYVIPNETIMLEEYSRVASTVVSGIILTILNRIQKFFNLLLENFEDLSCLIKGCTIPPSTLVKLPVWVSIVNTVLKLEEANEKVGLGNNLIDTLETVCLLDIEKIQKGGIRNSVVILYRLSLLGTLMFNQLGFDPGYSTPKPQAFRIRKAFADLKRSLMIKV